MISLTSLSLENNYKDQNGYFTWGIHGKLPTELGKLKNLKHLHLNDNYISGTLISEIGQLYFLETLHLQSNFLLGLIVFCWRRYCFKTIILMGRHLGCRQRFVGFQNWNWQEWTVRFHVLVVTDVSKMMMQTRSR
jgi:hypothetical protein